MKIKIINKAKCFTFYLPAFSIKTKLFHYLCFNNSLEKKEIEDLYKSTLVLYKELKKYVKDYGHFSVLNIESKDGIVVEIFI